MSNALKDGSFFWGQCKVAFFVLLNINPRTKVMGKDQHWVGTLAHSLDAIEVDNVIPPLQQFLIVIS
jgi:hypothetical protein